MKKYVIVGAYEDNGQISASFEGIFKTKEEAQDMLDKLFEEAISYGLDDSMDSDIYENDVDIYYGDGSHQIYEIKEIK